MGSIISQKKPSWAIAMMRIVLLMALVGCGLDEVDVSTKMEQESAPGVQPAQTGDDVKIDAAIRNLVEGPEFLEADLAQRKRLAKDLMSSLEQDGLIHDVYYDEEGQQYSFIYADGSLGGIDLVPFDEEMN